MTATDPIPLARPAIEPADELAAARALRSGRLVLGPENQRFEARLAALTGRAYAVCVTSGTTALELGLWALGIGSGDTVLVSAAGFPAAAHAARRLGAQIALVDVDSQTWNPDPARVAAAVDDIDFGAGALVSIDLFGLVADGGALAAAAAGVPIIDDAACSLGGCDAGGHPGGGYGAIGALSFHPRKVITTGEGGAAVCDDAALAERLRALRNHGQAGRGRFSRAGTNARLSEVAAAIGCSQLDRLDAMLRERGLLAAGYRERLAPLFEAGRLSWQQGAPDAMHAYQTFAVMLDERAGRDRRDALIAALAARDIEAGVAAFALTRLPSLAGAVVRPAPCPVAEALDDRGVALPLYIGMRSAELDRVCDAVTEALG